MRIFLLWLSAMCGLMALLPAQNLQRIGHLPYPQLRLSGCWHHVDSAGGEWALVGTSIGLSIVDLADPTLPVERFKVPGIQNNWREVRTWAGYAYVSSDADSSGITIVNLNFLPDSIQWKVWRGDGFFVNRVRRSHTILAKEGHLYLFGGSNISDGAVIADLDDPWNPHILSKYAAHYVHDGFVRGDTLWTNEGNASRFGVVDISDKSNPVLLTNHPTPGGYSHNCETSNDGQTLFTTDERANAPLAAFDVSNLEDIRLLDLYKPSLRPEGEVHNVRVMPGDFLVCPSYRGQLTLVDASQPDNLIEIALDTIGNKLVWDADPYLPSGILLATVVEEGLFVYQPTYQKAARIQGTVTDALTGFPLSNAKVFVLNTPNADTTGANGGYKTGAQATGNYALRVERTGYQPQVVTNVPLVSGEIAVRDFALIPSVTRTEILENESIVRISPMPFEDFLRIEIPADSPLKPANTMFRLTDFSGKIILETRSDASGVTVLKGLSNLPSGPYLLSVSGEQGFYEGRRVMKW